MSELRQEKSIGATPSVKRGGLSSRKTKTRVFIILMLAWPIAHFLVFWLYINGRTLLLMFQQFDRYGNVTGTPMSYYFVGLKNFIETFKDFFFSAENGGDIVLANAFKNSLTAFPLNIIVLLPMAYISAFVFFKKVRFSNVFRVLFYLPSIVSIVILTMLYKYMFDSKFGPVYQMFSWVGYTPNWFDLTTKSSTIWPLIYVYCIWAGLGMNVILISGAMSRIPAEVLESGKLDGVGFWRECVQIVLPLIWPTISTLIVMGTMSVFGFMIQPYLLAGEGGGYEGQTMTISLYIFSIVRLNSSKAAAVSAATTGMMFCILLTPFVFVIKWLTEKFGRDVEF
ncbi:MAG: sugar ABC transporter permease [Clostridiales bacterium]|jgi:ABC-type sugar transport system permease subunit|nr:sugar ABC transporter permease [Clostridiales bacterium]